MRTLHIALLGSLAIGQPGCRCRSDVAPAPPPLPHYHGWPRLVEKAALGEIEGAAAIALDLTEGPEGEVEDPAAAAGSGKVGAALGFMAFAEDTEELADAVASAARGCGMCHTATGAVAPPRPEWSHFSGAAWVVDGLVWSRTEPPPRGGDPLLGALAEAWARPVPSGDRTTSEEEVRAARVVAACAACHITL